MELELAPLNLPSDNERPFVIAGPCSAETEEQVMTTARELAMKGCHNFRAGVWKPRTKPGGFEGHGEPALVWLIGIEPPLRGMILAIVIRAVSAMDRVATGIRMGTTVRMVVNLSNLPRFVAKIHHQSVRHFTIPIHLFRSRQRWSAMRPHF